MSAWWVVGAWLSVALCLALPARAELPRDRRSGSDRPRPRTAAGPPPPAGWFGLAALTLLVLLVAGADLAFTEVALALIGGLVLFGVSRALARARRARAAAARRQQVMDACEALLGELRAGQPTLQSLERAARTWPELQPVVAAARLGADIPAAFRHLAREPGASGLERIAAAWELCATAGAGLAFGIEQVLDTARAEQATGQLVIGELASAKATARLVVALPVVVLLTAQGLGAQAWPFLLDTVPGVLCLGAGVGLALVGLWWIDRIADAAVPGGL